jgi:hypothetical protein
LSLIDYSTERELFVILGSSHTSLCNLEFNGELPGFTLAKAKTFYPVFCFAKLILSVETSFSESFA